MFYHATSNLYRALRQSYVFVLGLFAAQLVGDDFLGTYRLYDVDQETGEISEMEEGLSKTISIAKEDDGSYTAVITREVSKEQWLKSQVSLRNISKEGLRELENRAEQHGAPTSGAEPIKPEGFLDSLLVLNIDDQSYEKDKRQVETTTDVKVDGNRISIFVPFSEDKQSYIDTTKDEIVAREYYEFVIKNGELNGTYSDYVAPYALWSTEKIHAKRVSDTPLPDEESDDTGLVDFEDPD